MGTKSCTWVILMSNKQYIYNLIEVYYKINYKILIKKFTKYTKNKSDAEDIVQEAFARSLQYWNTLDVDKDIGKWFWKIIINCLRDKMSEEKIRGMSNTLEEEFDLEPRELNNAIKIDVEKEINKQAENKKNILTLFFLKQYKPSEISKIVPENVGHIRVIIHEFRKHLRTLFGKLYK